MLRMLARILLFFLCPALLAAGGCARSNDGTVVIPKPLDVRRIWDKPPPQEQAIQSQLETGVFPVAPQPARKSATRRPASPAKQTRRVTSNPPARSSETENPLTCRNVSEPGKRYRVVCE
jgi:hypothetical protein